ncbi:MAG: sigma 54-interacting transcriptional regulator, partial [Candidatus Marinimicrobia bacterium]|nr:sigma 54-interacting transcriptional regulator [Candidatus Neomarinimicrobiota bacterium]
VDVRIVSATNKNLEEEVNSGRFRSDLFYRLNVFPIHLPSLRERNEDIPLFVEYFVKKYADKMNKKINIIPKTVLNNLKTYHWPGNIRELENIIERAVVLTKTSKLIIDNRINVRKDTPEDQKMLTLDAVQKNHILSVLTKTNGKISGDTGAANILGIKSTTLRARMLKLNIK